MNMIEALKSYFRKSFDFKSRSSRSEYWWVVLFNTIIVAFLITMMFQTTPEMEDLGIKGPSLVFNVLYYIFLVVNIIPGAALLVRRFHDQNKSGWFSLLFFAPFGPIIILVFMCIEGTKGPNRFGYDPLGGSGGIFD